MNTNIWILTFADSISIATTLILASLGALLTERSGVINLGVEGVLLMGVSSTFLVSDGTGNLWFALLIGTVVGALLATIHATLCVVFRANQIVSGLALVIFCTGLANFLAKPIEGKPKRVNLQAIDFGPLSDIPIIGPLIFGHDIFTYVTWAIVAASSYYMFRTRPGLTLRAVGDDPATVDSQGLRVGAIRFSYTVAGGALMGLAGGWFMLARSAAWQQAATTNGIGWIALALVVFAAWRPLRLVFGAVLFGFTLQLPFTLQAEQITVIPAAILPMIPYLVTLAVLIAMSTPRARAVLGAPKALGQPFVRDER